MRKIYFIIFGVLLGISCNFTYSMESNPLYRSAEGFSPISPSSREMGLRRSHSRGVLLKQEDKFIRGVSPKLNQTSPFDHKKLASKSPFTIGYGYDCVEETELYTLDQVRAMPIAIPAKEGIIIVALKGFMKNVPNLCSLYHLISTIKEGNKENLHSVSQLSFTYRKEHLVVAYGSNNLLQENIELRNKEEKKSTSLSILFIPYENYEQYCGLLLKCIQQQSGPYLTAN